MRLSTYYRITAGTWLTISIHSNANAGNKLMDQIFDLKFTSKQLVRQAKKCEKEEKTEKLKVCCCQALNAIQFAKPFANRFSAWQPMACAALDQLCVWLCVIQS